MSDSETPWTAARQASLSIIKSQSLLKLMPIESVTTYNHLILCRPLLLLLLSHFSRVWLCVTPQTAATRLSVPGILQARTLEWVAISFSNAWKWKVKVKSLSHVQPLATPWTAAHQAPPSMGFSRQSTGVGCHCLLRSPPVFNLFQHQGLFQWVSSSHQVAKLLELQLQHQSFQWIFRVDFLWSDWLDLLAVQGNLKSLLNTTVWKHQFFGTQLSLWSNSHIHAWLIEKP